MHACARTVQTKVPHWAAVLGQNGDASAVAKRTRRARPAAVHRAHAVLTVVCVDGARDGLFGSLTVVARGAFFRGGVAVDTELVGGEGGEGGLVVINMSKNDRGEGRTRGGRKTSRGEALEPPNKATVDSTRPSSLISFLPLLPSLPFLSHSPCQPHRACSPTVPLHTGRTALSTCR